jgi:GMP synthase-like glutamine amidotransferase
MKPVLVLQHMSDDGPAHLAVWLRREGIALEVFDTEAGQTYPQSMSGYGALAVLGGAMSANDDLPSLRQAERLILEAMDKDLPVIGHCLGGQLMSRALGGEVFASPAPEVGWHRIEVLPGAEAASWFGPDDTAPIVFEWHFEAFSLPAGATLLAGNAANPHQAFSIGRHLGMQFHVELDHTKLMAWTASRDPTYLRLQRSCPTVHDAQRIRAEAASHLGRQQALADRLYRRWLLGREGFRIEE